MARTRSIKPAFFTSEQLAACTPLARLVFAGLWCLADRAGKLRDQPRRIKAQIMPYEAEPDADGWLSELAREGLILRYEGEDGERYLKVLEFVKHQNLHPKEPPSEIPEPRQAAADKCPAAKGRGRQLSSQAFPSGTSGTSGSSGPAGDPEPRQAAAVVAVAAPTKLPGKAERFAELYPATQAVLDALAAAGLPIDHAAEATTRAKVEQLVARIPVDQAVAAVRAGHARKGRLFVGWYLDELAAVALEADQPVKKLYVADLTWIERVPAERRAEARAAWEAKQAEVEASFRPDAVPRVLAESADLLRQEFAS